MGRGSYPPKETGWTLRDTSPKDRTKKVKNKGRGTGQAQVPGGLERKKEERRNVEGQKAQGNSAGRGREVR